MSVYDDLIPESSYPLYTIFIDIDPSRIDVNVHPTKQEIKFEDERIIYTFIQAGTTCLSAIQCNPDTRF